MLRCIAVVCPPYKKSKSWIRCEIKNLQRKKRFQPGVAYLNGNIFHYPDAASFAFAWKQIFLNECYRFKANSEFPRIIDCGANIGLASIYWKKAYPAASITAVEADPEVFAIMRRNFQEAGIEDIECIHAAIWHEEGEVEFASSGADAGGVITGTQLAAGKIIRVKAMPLNELLGGMPVDLLKIDVEGAECEILIGHHDWLTEVQRVFVEFHSYANRDQRLDLILTTLRRAGFRIHLHPELVSPLPFVQVRVDEGMDQRINIYAWRP
jgi:FkbM family methyltransferase